MFTPISEIKYRFEQQKNSIKLFDSGIRHSIRSEDLTVSETFMPYNRILAKSLVKYSEVKNHVAFYFLLAMNVFVSYIIIDLCFNDVTIPEGIKGIFVRIGLISMDLFMWIAPYLSYKNIKITYLHLPFIQQDGSLNYFVIRVEKNNHDEYLKFIDQLYELRRTYIRNVFFKIDSENEIELEKDKFQSMLDEEIISQSEYDLMEELLSEEEDDLEDEIDDMI